MQKTTIGITDDHKIVSEGIASFLIGSDEFILIDSSLSSKELFEQLKKKQPDILLLDIKLPGLSGLQIAKILKNDYPKIKIIFLSSSTDKESLDEAVKAGGVGYLSKDVNEEEFLFALNKVKSGENYYSKGIQQAVFHNYTSAINSETETVSDILSKREIEITKLFAEGLSYNEIAEKLFISKRTVETHKKNILGKLELKSTIDLVKYAILNGFISI